MSSVIIAPDTSIVDVAFNLSGSLAGIVDILDQLPASSVRIGFDTLPEPWEDVAQIDQTWTPDLQGMQLDLSIPIYNSAAVQKAPFATNLFEINKAVPTGDDTETWVKQCLQLINNV